MHDKPVLVDQAGRNERTREPRPALRGSVRTKRKCGRLAGGSQCSTIVAVFGLALLGC